MGICIVFQVGLFEALNTTTTTKTSYLYSEVQVNIGKGCVSVVHATFGHVYLDSRVYDWILG